MGCENLATKEDVQAILSAIKSSEARIVNELNIKASAISEQISSLQTTLLGKSQEILNAVLSLRQKVESVENLVLVVIPIVNNIVGVVIGIQAELRIGISAILSVTNNISAKLEIVFSELTSLKLSIASVLSAVLSIEAEISLINSNILALEANLLSIDTSVRTGLEISSETNNNVRELKINAPTVNNRLDVLSTNVQTTNNSLNTLSVALPKGGGGGTILDIILPRVNIILDIIKDLQDIVNNIDGSGGCSELTQSEIELKEYQCIDCEAKEETSDPCTSLERETGAEIRTKTVTGILEAVKVLDEKLLNLGIKECKPEDKSEYFVQVRVDGEPRKSKIYYGASDRETVVFAGWVKFFASYTDTDGNLRRFDIGLEQPIRRLEEFFKVPDYCSGYHVQPMNEAQVRHRLILVQNGKVITELLPENP